jgi:energy-coupling factor transporter ATP-binding protein EcfA2
MPVKEWTISEQQPFTEEVKFNFDDHVNLFIGPNGTGKSTLIRKLWTDHRNQASVLVPANRLGLPSLHDDAGHQALVQGIEEGPEFSSLMAANQYVFDAKRTLLMKQVMTREALRGSRSGETLEQYFRALTLAYQCTRKICGEILADDPPEIYTRNNTISVRESVVTAGGNSREQLRQVAQIPYGYEGMGISVTHDIPYSRLGTYNKVFTGDLSDGTQGTLSWIEYMAAYIAYRYRFERNWESRPSMLFIDEIESHLHPTWQRRVLPALREHFPQLQIFATTHSPFLVAGLDAGQVHRLYRDDNLTVRAEAPNSEQIVGWTMDEILRGLMGVQDPTDRKTAEQAQELRRLRNLLPLDDKAEEEQRLQRIAELEALLDSDLLAGGVATADQELFEQQFNAALERYRQANDP